MSYLSNLGWSPARAAALPEPEPGGPPLAPARVLTEQRGSYLVQLEEGPLPARLAGRLRHQAADRTELPAVGDWVGVEVPGSGGPGRIRCVLPRLGVIQRKVPERQTVAQVLAANVQWAFVVTTFGREFRARRLERFLALIREGDVDPVVVLNKLDLCEDPAPFLQEVRAVGRGVPVHPVSALTGEGLEALEAYLGHGVSAVLLGLSGVGKSTLINRLLGEDRQLVREIREDDQRGRHTTTARHLLPLPAGGALIDTPGLREVSLWEGAAGLEESFDDVEALAAGCRFRDCRHREEPGCAVLAALAEGELEEARLRSYRHLKRELAHIARQQDIRARKEENRRWKQITMSMRRRRLEE